jgi:hypothetical protein
MRLPLALLACLLAASIAAGEEVTLSLGLDGETPPRVNAELHAVDEERLLGSLSDGLESTVTFELRLYRRARGLWALFGDRLVGRESVRRTASMDFLDGRYILVDEGGEVRRYPRAEDFVRHFLSLHALRLPWPAASVAAAGGGYLLARARLEYVRLEAPLNIIGLFRPTAAVTEWRRVDLGRRPAKEPTP